MKPDKTKIMSWMIVVVCRLEQSIGNLYRLSIRLAVIIKEKASNLTAGTYSFPIALV
jgi:hypothetical protein